MKKKYLIVTATILILILGIFWGYRHNSQPESSPIQVQESIQQQQMMQNMQMMQKYEEEKKKNSQ